MNQGEKLCYPIADIGKTQVQGLTFRERLIIALAGNQGVFRPLLSVIPGGEDKDSKNLNVTYLLRCTNAIIKAMEAK